MTRPHQALFASLAITGFGLGLAGLQYLLTGFSEEFGVGVAVGLPLGGGLVLLGSQRAQRNPLINSAAVLRQFWRSEELSTEGPIIPHAECWNDRGGEHMPWWRRLLCILVGTPIALGGACLIDQGSPRVFIVGAFLLGIGGLLALSGLNPEATRNY